MKCEKFGSHIFSCQSLLLGTNVPNDIVAIIPFLRSPFDIHSSINSIILCGMFIHWNTTQYFEYAPYNYNSDHKYLQRLCQHFLKTSSPACHCTYTQSKRYYYYLQLDNVVMRFSLAMNKTKEPETNTIPTWIC